MNSPRIRVAALAAALAFPCLAGCQTTGTGGVPAATADAATPSNIAKAATAVCRYVPSASTIAGIVATLSGSGGAEVASASAIADAICRAVAPSASGPGLDGVRQGYAFGVRVRGRFVR
jgi:hypothetical protein